MKANRASLFFLLALPGMPSPSAQTADAGALREFSREADRASWKVVSSALLSPDGKWLAYVVMPAGGRAREGEVEIVLRSVPGDGERRYVAGDKSLGAGALKMSPSGRWIAFCMTPNLKEAVDFTRSGRPIRRAVAVVEVRSGEQFRFPDVQGFSFVGNADERIVLQGYPEREGETAFTLVLRKPDDTEAATWTGVTEFAFDESGKRLAIIDGQGLRLYEPEPRRRTLTLEASAKSEYRGLVWAKKGSTLAVFRRDRAEPKTESGTAIIAFSSLGSDVPKKQMFDPTHWAGFPKGYEISTEAVIDPESTVARPRPAITWRQDEDGLFFGVRRVRETKEAPQVDVFSTPAPGSNLVLWHWRDARLPAQRKAEASADATFSYLSFVSLADSRFVRLADATVPIVVPHVRGRYVLGYDAEAYNRASSPNLIGTGRSAQYRDYYLVNLQNGERTLVAKGLPVLPNPQLSVAPQLSPDGRYVLFQDGGDYVSYEAASGERRNLTARLPTQFYYKENLQNRRHLRERSAGSVLQGWTHDGMHVLISDYYDVWALPLRGGRALNLTGNGRRENISYERASLDRLSASFRMREETPVDIREPIYFRTVDWKTADTGLARRRPGRTRTEWSRSDAANTFYFKAERADVYLSMRMTATEPANYYLVGSDWRAIKRLTDVNPRQREIRMSPGAKYLTYITAHGDRLHADLRLPAGYVQGQRYPTIVSIYERRSGNVHNFSFPNAPDFDWLQHGYAVLYPDIQPRLNEPGPAALEAVLAAVDAAVATGIVDRGKLALTGHSYGGYETYFIVSQTDIFKAAVPQSGWTNLWSAYGAVWADRIPVSHAMEREQTYMAGPWWEHWDAYIQNSPLFHTRNIKTPLLIVHGNRDQAVRFSQAEEIFNTLRRMGDKPVVLLEYRGEDHTFEQDHTRRDLSRRMLSFFDHFLKDAPAPNWWSEGVSHYEGHSVALAH